MKRKPRQERRSYPRYLTTIRAQCFHVLSDGTSERVAVKVAGVWADEKAHAKGRGMVRDVSFGGLYLESVRPFREGTILVIELAIPKRKAKVVVVGLVRWVKLVKADAPFNHGLGIQFIYMNKADWETLQTMFRELKPSALEPQEGKKGEKK